MFMATKARWNTEGDSSASRSRGWMLDDIETRYMVEVGLLVESGLDGDVGSFGEYVSGFACFGARGAG
ncbi:hypothetical protein BASA81_013638 [Batrachochytrium salamandrivorans]|nr:hypothetical protein BASA81_013638 [Batrachochytrium salamandrivorans]